MPDEGKAAGTWRPLGAAIRYVYRCIEIRDGPSSWFGWGARWFGLASGSVGSAKPVEKAVHEHNMESLGRVAAGVAHDFNNLLTVVLGNAASLRAHAEACGDTPAAQRAEVIERAAERGGRLAGQLLAFSRKQILRPETVSAYRVIAATHDLLAQAAGEKARVLLHADPGLWNCRVDPGQLESAILNLVLNARDAMPAGGNITISCHNERFRQIAAGTPDHLSGDYVRIEVSDPGAGIPPELREKVFEPFFTTRPIGQGSGLGLAQVHGFAGQSGGWVDLDSAVGRGTTVHLFLPRSIGPPSDWVPKADDGVSVGGNELVMVVASRPDERDALCGQLNRAGFRAFGVADSASAFAHLASNKKIDAFLTGAKLTGGVSGVALARSALQARPALSAIVIGDRNGETNSGAADRLEFIPRSHRSTDLVRVLAASLAANTFSIETEQLLAETKHAVSRTVSSEAAAAVSISTRRTGIRLGVMPFVAIGPASDPAFSAGLAEEITTAFARFRWITGLAPASVASLCDEPLQSTRWQDLDLDFLIRGSFRKKGNDIRVVLRLTNMRGADEITWGRRFDGLLPDVLTLQDQIASETAAQMAPELLVWEAMEARSRPRVDPDAYDMMLRAIPAIYRLDEVSFLEAGTLLERSRTLDPASAACHSWLAHWYLLALGQGWASDVPMAIQRARELSERAITLDPNDARGFAIAGHVRAFLQKDPEGARDLHERALALNLNLALAWCYSGLTHCYLGQHREAIRRVEHAKRLSPLDPHGFFFDTAMAMPLLLTGQYEATARMGRQARDRHPGLSSTHKLLLAALGHLGMRREAALVRKGLLLLEPDFSIAAALARSPLRRQEDLDCYLQGLRLAGVPERSGGRRFRFAITDESSTPALAPH